MKPIYEMDDDAQHNAQDSARDASSPLSQPGPTSQPEQVSWLWRAIVGVVLVLVAVLGFGSSAGWFSRDLLATKNSNDAAPIAGTSLPPENPIRSMSNTASNTGSNTAQATGEAVPAVENNLAPAANPPPLAALIPDQSLEIIAECRRVAKHLQQLFPGALEAQEMQARLEFQLGDIEQARAIWLKILETEPNYVHALRGVGDVCTLNGELKEAVQYFRRAVLAEPLDLTRQVTLGVALLQAAEVEQATEVLRAVVTRDPQQVGAHAELGKALSQAGDYQTARTHFEAALKEEARLADPSKAHFGLATALQRLGETELAKHHQQEYVRLRKSDTQSREGERRDYDDVQAIGLDAARLYVDMARVYLAGGQIASAELLLLRASRMNPTDLDCRQALAFVALNQNKLQDAIRWLREIATLRPEDFTVTQEIARLYAQLDAPESAERVLQEYLEGQPKSADALGALAELYMVVIPDAEKAVEFAQANADVNPTALSFSKLATAQELAQNFDAAIIALKRAVELAPGNALYTQRLALLREAQSATSEPKKP